MYTEWHEDVAVLEKKKGKGLTSSFLSNNMVHYTLLTILLSGHTLMLGSHVRVARYLPHTYLCVTFADLRQ